MVVELANCDFNGNVRIDPLDLLMAVAKAEPETYRVPGKAVYKLSQEMPPFVAITRHAFVDSLFVPTGTEGVTIRHGQSRFRDATVNEITVHWVRVQGQRVNDIFITLSYSDQENWSEEQIRNALLKPETTGRDPNGDGSLDKWDIAIISALLVLPKGVVSDSDPRIEAILYLLEKNGGYLQVDVALAWDARPTKNKSKLTTIWAGIKEK